jgi:hypothetical protein
LKVKQHTSKIVLFLVLLLTTICIVLYLWRNTNSHNTNTEPNQKTSVLDLVDKHRGAHLFGSLDTININVIANSYFNYITLVPWGFQDSYKSAVVTHHNFDSTNIRSGNIELLKRIKLLKDKGYKVFIKPHVWVDKTLNKKWRSDIFPENSENWELWKTSYRDFIFRYARIAEKGNADMFCIGTEFSRLAIEKPIFWKTLIKDLRKIFSGKLTYAANWNKAYKEITFWNDLDFIGIQAYFPLTNKLSPSIQDLNRGWKKYIPTLDSLNKVHNKKIIFTEMGYKSTADAGIEPWKWIEKTVIDKVIFSNKTQANCYEAFFYSIWDKDWFAGSHIWQLRTDYKVGDEKNNLDFFIQGKPAEKILNTFFKQKENAQSTSID